MKKIIKTSLFLAALLSAGMMTTNAKTMTTEQLNNLVTVKVGSQNLSQNLYIFGKYVFVNTITSAELNDAWNETAKDPDYMNSYRELFKDNVAALIHKDSNNNWENLTYGGSLAKSVSIEMTHLIGDLSGEHISNEDGIYDGTYIKQEKLPSQRTAEIFVDQKAKLNIADIKATDGKGTLESHISTDTHAHNTKALGVEFSKDLLTLSEKMPLLEYNNGTSNAKWVGLVIKTNKALTKTDRIVIGSVNYTIEGSGIQKLESAAQHGGDASDYLVWLNADDLKTNPNILVQVKNDNNYDTVQTIKLAYTAVKVSFTDEVAVSENGKAPVVETNRDGVKSAVAKINDKYVVLFYTDDTKISQVEYTIDGDKKFASKNSAYDWTKTDLIQVLGVDKTTISTPNSNQTWNQGAISISAPEAHTYTEDEPYDYIVKVHYNKGLKNLTTDGVSVDVDLSVGAGYITDTNVANTTKWTVKLTKDEDIKSFENEKIADGKDKVAIKFVLVDEVPEMTVEISKGAEVDLFKDPTQAQSGINGNYKYNLQNVNLTSTKTDDGYEVILQQVDKDKALAKFSQTKANDTTAAGHPYIGVIVNFGDVALSNISDVNVADGGAETPYAIDNAKNVEVAQYFGATNANSYVLWIYQDETIKFTNTETNKSVTVKFDLRTLKATYVKDNDTNAAKVTDVVIDPAYADQVQYVAGQGFIVNDGVTKFVAKTTITDATDASKSTTADYTYVITGNNAKKVQNLNLTKVYAIETDANQKWQYNADAIKSVTPNGKEINVVFKKNVQGSFALALNLGLGTYTNDIYAADATGAKTGSAKEAVAIGRFKGTVPTDLGELVLVWLNSTTTASEDGQKIDLVHETDSGTSVVYSIIVKSTVENEQPELELKSDEKVTIDSNKLSTEEYQNMKNNFEATSVREEDGKIVISYSKELTKYASSKGQETKYWFGVIVDLGVDPRHLTSEEYSINSEDYEDIAKFGGKEGSTQFIMWFSKEDFDTLGTAETDEYGEETGRHILEITFKNDATSEDQYAEPIKLTFVLEDAREELELKSIEELPTNADVKVSDMDLFKLNQERFESSYDFDSNTLTVKPSLEDNKFASYGSAEDSEVTLTNGEWYAVQVDFGKDVKLKFSYTTVILQKVEGSTKAILWVNKDAMSNKSATFVDVNNGMEYVMTFKLDK